MLVRTSCLAVVISVILGGTLLAQSHERTLLVGPIFGASGAYRFGSISVYAGSPECGVFESGLGSSMWGGIRLALPQLFGRWGAQTTVALSHSVTTMNTTPVDPQFIRSAETGELVELDRRYQLRTALRGLRLDLLASTSPHERLVVAFGPSLTTFSSVEQEQVDTILGPGRTSFSDGQRSHPMTGRTELRPAFCTLDAVASVGYTLPLAKGGWVALVPELQARLGLVSAFQGLPLRGFELGASLALLVDLLPSSEPEPPSDTTQPQRVPLLAAAIDLRGVDAAGVEHDRATVTVDEVLSRRYVPLLPAIFFEQGATTPASRYILTDSATLSRTDNLDPMTIHVRIFQVLGERMRAEPSAQLTLFGSTTSGEPASLAYKRAVAVRDLLVARCGIAPERITVGSGDGGMRRSSDAAPDGRAENRRVVIASSSPRILAPFVMESVDRTFDPPGIVAHPTMQAEAGVRRWEVVLRQADVVVQRASSDGDESMTEMVWTIGAGQGDTTLTPISAVLEVEDSTGARIVAHDEMPVSVRRRARVVGGRGRDDADSTIYTLVAFDFNDIEPLEENRKFLEEVVATFDGESQVEVVGFTDRLGEPAYNSGLSRRRAERVGAMLRDLAAQHGLNVSVVVEGQGANESRFTNELPEGRIFSRGVQVRVTRPVGTTQP